MSCLIGMNDDTIEMRCMVAWHGARRVRCCPRLLSEASERAYIVKLVLGTTIISKLSCGQFESTSQQCLVNATECTRGWTPSPFSRKSTLKAPPHQAQHPSPQTPPKQAAPSTHPHSSQPSPPPPSSASNASPSRPPPLLSLLAQ